MKRLSIATIWLLIVGLISVSPQFLQPAFASGAPVVSSVFPTAGPLAGGTSVTITGSGFTGATAVSFGGTAASAFTVVNDTSISATTPAKTAGSAAVVVTSGSASNSDVNFTFAPIPTISSVTPSSGPTGGSTTITIVGTGFFGGGSVSAVSGVTVGGVSATSVSVASDTSLTAVTPSGTAGAQNVVVTTPGGPSAASSFTYLATPTISALSPASGSNAGGTFVTVTGTGFLAGGASAITGVTVGGAAATSIDNVTATSFTMVTPAGTNGAQNVIVTTTAGVSSAFTFTYGAASDFPVLSSLTPTSGTVRGGTTITITGTGFAAVGNEVWIGSEQATVVTQSTTSITATTPTRTSPANGTGLTVGPKIVRVKVPDGAGFKETGDEKYFSFVPNLETPANQGVVLGALADRSQGKPLTQSGNTVSGTVGIYGSSGSPYSYQTNNPYSGTGQLTESTEVSISTSFSTSLSGGEWELSTSGSCTHNNQARTTPLGGGGSSVSGTSSYCSYFGPQLWSEPFYATQGQSIAFTWRAQGGGDDYEVYAFLVNVGTNQAGYGTAGPYATFPVDHTNILYSRGRSATSTTSAADIPADGLYRFRFVNGTFDRSGGFVLGATMYVSTSVSLGRSNTITFAQPANRVSGDPDPFTVTASASSGQQVTFAGSGACSVTSSAHTGTVTSAVITRSSLASNTCSLTASQDGVGLFAPAASVTRTFTYPTVSAPGAPTNLVATPLDGSASISFTAPASDGGAAISNYQYSINGGVWTAVNPASSATTLLISGLTNGVEYSIRVRAVNLQGGGTQSAIVTVTPAVPTVEVTQGAVTRAITPIVPVRPRQIVLPPQGPVQAPVLQNNQVPVPPNTPTAIVNGIPAQLQTQITDPNNLSLRTGVLNIALNVQTNQGLVRQGTNGETEVQVRNGGVAGFQGSGLAPRSFVQVFMPLQGTNAKELARIPVDETGNFNGEAVFQTSFQEPPLPIGRQVLQMVTVDEQGRQNVVEIAVNIVQPQPSPELNRENGTTPQLAPGQSLAMNAGVPEVVNVTVIEDQKQTVIEGDGWVMSIAPEDENSNVVQNEEGEVFLELVRDEAATVAGTGFMPNTRADVWLFSEPTLLGTVDIDENGEFNGTVEIDGQVVNVGEHTLQMQGVGEDGYVRAANLGVVVNDADAASTEEAAGSFLWWWLLLLVLIAIAVGAYLWWRKRQLEATS